MKYTWLLFDADDTLFDFPTAEANALRWTFEQLNLPYHTEFEEIYHRCNEQVWKEFERGEVSSVELRTKRFRLMFDQTGISSDPQLVSPRYLQNLALGTELFDNAEMVIRNLKQKYRLALVTNGLADVQRPRLARSALHDCFEKVFISEEIGVAKPAVAFFDAVFTEIGKPPKEAVLLIGDSLTSDMRGGVDYGIDTCWYNPKGKTSQLAITYEIKSLPELLKLLM